MQIEPKTLVKKSDRPDLWAKYFYVLEYLENGVVSENTKQAYLETLRYINGFISEEPPKRYAIEFITYFEDLIESIKSGGINNETSRPISITNNGIVLDGAHRIAICAALNLEINPRIVESSQTQHYSFKDLLRLGMSETINLHILRTIIMTNPDFRILLIYPIAEKHTLMETLISQYENEILFRTSYPTEENLLAVIKYINYVIGDGQQSTPAWINQRPGPKLNIMHSAKMSSGVNELEFLIFTSKESCLALKQAIRELLDFGNYPCHSSDSQFESLILVEQILDSSSRAFAEMSGLQASPEILEAFTSITRNFSGLKLQNQHIYVVGSAVMALLGIRQIRDIDLYVPSLLNKSIATKISSKIPVHLIEGQNDDRVPDIHQVREWITFLGLRVQTIETLAKFKSVRLEDPKDLNDLELIQKFTLGPSSKKKSDKSSLKQRFYWRFVRLRESVRIRVRRFPLLFRILSSIYRYLKN